MDEFEVEIRVLGTFSSAIKPQLTKDIRVVSEYPNTEDPSLSETSVAVGLTAPSDFEAIYQAQKKLNQFLAFYSAMTLDHFKILLDVSKPIKSKKLTGNREVSEWEGTNFEFLDEFNPKILVESVMPHYSLLNEKGNEYLKIALEYLLLARFEEFAEFKILNCMVTLEALFSRSGDNTEIGYKISNRAATLLGKDQAHRIELRKEIKELYNLRSRIIHGDPLELSHDAFSSLFIWCNDAITRFLTLAKKHDNHNKIIERIDDAMIDNSILIELRKESSDLMDILDLEHGRLIDLEDKRHS